MIKIPYKNIPFGPYLFQSRLPEAMIDRLYQDGKQAGLVSHHKELAGHLHGQYHYNEDTVRWFLREISPYWAAYREGHSNFFKLEHRKMQVISDELWINFMKAGDYNPLHTHGGHYSFVIFLDIPKDLPIEQEKWEGNSSPPGSLRFDFTQFALPPWAMTSQTVLPQRGDIYIFPALLLHTVCPFKCEGTRVSVSGNWKIKDFDSFPQGYF